MKASRNGSLSFYSVCFGLYSIVVSICCACGNTLCTAEGSVDVLMEIEALSALAVEGMYCLADTSFIKRIVQNRKSAHESKSAREERTG